MSRRARLKESPRKMIRVPLYNFRCPTKTSEIGLRVTNIIELLFARAKTKLDVNMPLPLFTMIS